MPTMKHVRVNATSDGDNTVIAAVSGKKLVIVGYMLNVDAAGVITLQNSAGTPVIYASAELTDGGSISYAGTRDAPAFVVDSGTAFEVSNAAGVNTLGHVTYYETEVG